MTADRGDGIDSYQASSPENRANDIIVYSTVNHYDSKNQG
jgi:hypothetical protein